MEKDFFRRLKLYVFGLLLGTILSYLIFGDRLTEYFRVWLPEGRVKAQIKKVPVKISPAVDSAFLHHSLEKDSQQIKHYLLQGNVKFSKSDVHKECPEYYMALDSLPFDLWIIVCRESTYVSHPLEK